MQSMCQALGPSLTRCTVPTVCIDQVGFIGELAVSIVLTVLTIQFRFTIEFVEDLRRSGEHFDILARCDKESQETSTASILIRQLLYTQS